MNVFYLWLWLIYGFAALGLVISAWYGLRGLKSQTVQDLLLLFLIALFFTPSTAVSGGTAFAPALVVWLIEALLSSDSAGWRGAGLIIGVFVGSSMLMLLRNWVVQRMSQTRLASNHDGADD